MHVFHFFPQEFRFEKKIDLGRLRPLQEVYLFFVSHLKNLLLKVPKR